MSGDEVIFDALKQYSSEPKDNQINTLEWAKNFGLKTKSKHGSPEFYNLLEEMKLTHDKKSQDYSTNSDPFGNYHFAGTVSSMFRNPMDAGFAGRIAEKLYRLSVLENHSPINESVEDTETDIAVIAVLWMADRRARRGSKT